MGYDERMGKHVVHKILLLVGLLMVIVVIIVFAIPAIFGSSFSGETSHDFGLTEIQEGGMVAMHVFRLKNESDQELMLVKAVPTCGCTTTGWPDGPILPGKLLELPVHLSLERSELKKSKIKLLFDNGEVVILNVQAEGRFSQPMTLAPLPIQLIPDDKEGTWAILTLERFEGAPPDMPVVQLPKGLTIKFDSWERTRTGDTNKGTPDKWKLTMQVYLEGTLNPHEMLEFHVEEYPTLSVSLLQSETKERPRFR